MGSKNRRLFELRLGKTGLAFFIFGMSLLIFSGFLIGVVVGKHMDAYPERYASGFMVMIRDHLLAALPGTTEGSAPKEALEPGDEKFNLTFFDTLGKKGGAAPAADPPKKKAVPPQAEAAKPRTAPAPTDEGGTGRPKPPAEEAAGAAAVQNSSPSAAAEAPAKRPAAGKGRFEIQAAAYREQEQAEQLAKKITALGLSAQVVMKDIPGKGRWFRVIVDGFESREKAQEASERMVAGIRGLKCVIRPSGSGGNEN